MRVILQRVSRGEVRVAGEVVGRIAEGYVALIGVERGDGDSDVAYICRKILGLRLFPDDVRNLNQALGARAVLAISQFTLLADLSRGLRPSFDRAADPAAAQSLYEAVIAGLRAAGVTVATGIFGASMEVELVNQGPVTILLDSRLLDSRSVSK